MTEVLAEFDWNRADPSLTEVGVLSAVLAPSDPRGGGALLGAEPSAALIYDVLGTGGAPQRRVMDAFEVIAGPGQPVGDDLRAGDLWIERALGEGSLARLSLVTDVQTQDGARRTGIDSTRDVNENGRTFVVRVTEVPRNNDRGTARTRLRTLPAGANPVGAGNVILRPRAPMTGTPNRGTGLSEEWSGVNGIVSAPPHCSEHTARRALSHESLLEAVPIRNDPEYVHWIQEALNQVLGTGLSVDGVLRPETTGAIRRFQKERRLVADGVVGPITERALIDAGVPVPPPLNAQPLPVPPVPAGEARIDPRDERVDVSAKFALQRMLKSSDMHADAVRLTDGINTGRLAGIFGDDLQATVRLAQRHGTQRWLLVPQGEDAALVLDPVAPMTAPPTIIFRRPTRTTIPGKAIDPKKAVPFRSGREFGVRDPQTGQKVITHDLPPERLDPALQKASRTFELWQRRQLKPCAGRTSAIPVPNLMPSSFCHQSGRDLVVVVTEEGTQPGQPPVLAPNVAVQVVGPSPSTNSNKLSTDLSGQSRFQDLPPGSYDVTARKEGFKEASAQVLLSDGDEQIATFAGSGQPSTLPGAPKTVPLQLSRITTQLILIEHPDQSLPNAPNLTDEARWGVLRKGGLPGGATTPLPDIPPWEDAAIRILRRSQGPLLFPVGPDVGGNPRNGEATIRSAAGNLVSVISKGVHKAPILWHVTSGRPIGTIDGLQEARLTGRVRFSLWADPNHLTENNMSKGADRADEIVDDLSLLITVQNDTQKRIQPDWDVGLRPSKDVTEDQVIGIYRKVIERCHAHKIQVLAGFGLVDRGQSRILRFDAWLDDLSNPKTHPDGGKAEATRFANAVVDFINAKLPGFDGISFDIESCGLFAGSPLVPVNKNPSAHKDKIDKLRRALRFFYHAVADRLVVDNRICAITVGGMMSDDAAVLPLPSVPNVNPNALLAARLHTYDLPIGKSNIVIRPMGYDNAGGVGHNAKIRAFNSDPGQFEWHKAIVEFALQKKRVSPQQFQLGIKDFRPKDNASNETGQGGTVPEPGRILRRCTEILRPNRVGLILFALFKPPSKKSLGEPWDNNARYNRALNADPSNNSIPRPRKGQPLQVPLNGGRLANIRT